ncbi:MAG: hypothetical protein U0822_24090 [Anaerolineae bacterium]
MPTKTDRILGRLPSIYKARPAPSVLYSVTDAFGNELLQAENSLAALMLAHWVDHADKGAEFIDDLRRIGALYGLSPRPDETVEEFRAHLKRYVRIFLEGPSTVQGVLRITAESLGLQIDDDYSKLDSWWTRPDDSLTTVEPRGDDAASLLFGMPGGAAVGQAAQAAQIVGDVDLPEGAALTRPATLRLKVDRDGTVEIPLPAGASLDSIIATINTTCHRSIATHDGRRLVLTSPTTGPSSRLEAIEGDNDAAPDLLGLMPHTYLGGPAVAARATSADFGAGLDLRDERFLRLSIDNRTRVEVDCAASAADASHVRASDVASAINAALKAIGAPPVASVDGTRLVLTSPTQGFASTLTLEPAAAQDARQRLFGAAPSFYTGRDAASADVTGRRDLSGGVDLRQRSQIRLRLDNRAPVTVTCAGENPGATQPDEIVTTLNRALGENVASHDGRFIRVTSRTTGAASQIAFEALPADVDATDAIFGIRPRVAQGAAATRARLVGVVDLPDGVDLRASHQLSLAVDGAPPVEIDARDQVKDAAQVSLEAVATAINAALPDAIAARDGDHLVLTSPTPGAASRIDLLPLTTTRRRRFVTRAMVTDEAAQIVHGFVRKDAVGSAGSVAQVQGEPDLSRGVDLRQNRYLRLSVDGGAPVDIDCAAASGRPRIALPQEIAGAINTALHAAGIAEDVASTDGHRLTLTSPTAGQASRIAFAPPRGMDAGVILLGENPTVTPGRPPTGVSFLGTADLSQGIDLPAHATLRLRVDDVTSDAIDLTGDQPQHMTQIGLAIAINLAFQTTVARPDGAFLRLITPTTGSQSKLEFLAPGAGQDATSAVFGIAGGRQYHGADATPPRLVGQVDLSQGADLPANATLALSVNGQRVEIAMTADTGGHKNLAEIVDAINTPSRGVVASSEGGRLALTGSAAPGASLSVLPVTGGDARPALFGSVSDETTGQDATPATITGEVDLLKPADLSERRVLRVAVDGGLPVDIDIAGAAPASTTLTEIVARLNAAVPGLASATDDAHLRLTSPTAGPQSRLSVLPNRALELIEYAPRLVSDAPRSLQHGARWTLDNVGAAEADLTIDLLAPQGTVGPTFVNCTTGQRLRVLTDILPGGRLRVWTGGGGLRAAVTAPDGSETSVPPSKLLSGPLGAQIILTGAASSALSGGQEGVGAQLQLNDPGAPALAVLHARRFGAAGSAVQVTVAEAAIPGQEAPAPSGQQVRLVGLIRVDTAGYTLVGPADAVLADLRAGPGVALANLAGRVAAVSGPFYPSDAAAGLMVVEQAAALFDVTLSDGAGPQETYQGVTIGWPADEQDGLVSRINRIDSRMVWAEYASKADALRVPIGRSEWLYLDCYGARFDRDQVADPARGINTRFPGAVCRERGVFDVSRFAPLAGEAEKAVFAAGPITDGVVEVTTQREIYQPGTLAVNLPADLPSELGARFDEGRFGSADDQSETYPGFVTEPTSDPKHPQQLIGDSNSRLVTASVVQRVEIGFEPVSLPIRHPRVRTLQGGTATERARIYLKDVDVADIIKLEAREPGEAGNAIAVTVTKVDPAHFDMSISYQGGRFESARLVALIGQTGVGETIPAATADLLKPGPVGVLHAKAAGVHVEVTRDRTI